MSKTALIVTFDFPPSSSAAVQRTLKMVDYLKDFGWDCVILTAKPSAYERLETSQNIPAHVEQHVYRTIALDVHQHLSIKGKHFNWMKGIDRWSTWIPGAINCGNKILKKYKFDAIVSTAPIPSSHIIAGYLAKKSGIPWMADYQDPMAYLYEPTHWFRKFCHQKIDVMVTSNAAALVFATKQAMLLYQNAYPKVNKSKFHFVENGYDESNFQKINHQELEYKSPFHREKFTLYYSGVLYPNGRDPIPLFEALAHLLKFNTVDVINLEVVFQGAGTGDKFQSLINSLGIQDNVKFLPSVSYLESLYNMLHADALLLIQDEIFNLQVPGKLYEYIRVGKPILAITPPNSATADVANRAEGSFIGNDLHTIAEQILNILNFKNKINNNNLESFSRYAKTREFSLILDAIINKKTD